MAKVTKMRFIVPVTTRLFVEKISSKSGKLWYVPEGAWVKCSSV